ncbi:hypothetical protein [Shewanella donghaensis]|uniref:hypothetical protein n=1 Tax=Shewanella donghaensis TaxID=238836 RepID=UPI0011845C3F|nr:hypothetical protein [Shewanella donghaensis]
MKNIPALLSRIGSVNGLVTGLAIALVMGLSACSQSTEEGKIVQLPSKTEITVTCNEAWFKQVEQQLVSADGQGHGPDLGSDEWKSVIEFKLGVRGDNDVPDRNSEAWCAFVQQQLVKGS